MCFPRGYGAQKKVKACMEEFQKLHAFHHVRTVSSVLDSISELMEKRLVGVLLAVKEVYRRWRFVDGTEQEESEEKEFATGEDCSDDETS
ncbi:hypothetical protein RHSIM_Rhsim03G0002800 [Rhododendron simsii]|uniref:Uncharacterized protein n=1 Tax=Rhododendron simsii TaxID=118357 RepID=A0A834LS72_RHOSS|nr:hypothetical protein RHSIM_RhsimUnG0014000 [Rhododendron simsii]KAF7148287.1 hypothetical protein RHSIM_Rhsim03G0002800 [Rhododendron simsii]